MSRELWAVDLCEHGRSEPHRLGDRRGEGYCQNATRLILDFDAIWTRYYETADRRFEAGLTYDELFEVVYGEKEEE